LERALCHSATWISLIVSIIAGWLLGLNYGNVALSIVGWLLFILGFYIHYLSHKEHPKAHADIGDINYIATRGVYEWIRHPGYLGLILAFFGLALAFGSIPGLITASALMIHHYYLAVREEREMLDRFGELYAEYMRKVPDRFLPIKRIIKVLRHGHRNDFK